MRVAVISHTYIVELNRGKLQSLISLSPDIEVSIVVPEKWCPGGVQQGIIKSVPVREGRFGVEPLPNFSKSNIGMMSFAPDRLAGFLRKFRPDVIQVDQGSKSLAYAQTIALNKLLGLRASNILFTCWNLPYTLPLPLQMLEDFNLRNSHGLLCYNAAGIEILKEHGFVGPAAVIPQLGVDTKLFFPDPDGGKRIRAQAGLSEGDFVIGFAGRLVKEKGLRTLTKAFEKVRAQLSEAERGAVKLLIVGKGPLEDEMRQFAQTDGNVILKGAITHDEVPAYINAMNVFVLPSETLLEERLGVYATGWAEQFGHVIVEAMACGTVMVGSNNGEIPNVIGDAGKVFEEGSVDRLSEIFLELIRSPELMRDLSEKGRRRVDIHYTDAMLARKQLEFYGEVARYRESTGK